MRSPQSEVTSVPKAPAAEGPASRARRPASHPDGLLHLQRRYGNQRARSIIQAKLDVGPVDDPLEREADRVARLATGASPSVSAQRAPEAGRHVPAAAGGTAELAVAQAVERARGGGLEVPSGVRERMQRVTGSDLGSVRVHVGSEPDRLNDALGARAFTVGSDVFVRRSEYRPGTARGDALLGHELTHTVQQGATGPGLGCAPPTTAQRYVDIPATDPRYPTKHADKRRENDQHFFPSQQEVNGSWFEDADALDSNHINIAELRPNLAYADTPDLRFSDDFDLAVEIGAGVEPKVFYSTKERIKESNSGLTEHVRFVRTSRYLEVRLRGPDSRSGAALTRHLYQVEPQETLPKEKGLQGLRQSVSGMFAKAGPRGLQLRTPQDCETMSNWVVASGRLLAQWWAETLAEVLDEVIVTLTRALDPVIGSYAESWKASSPVNLAGAYQQHARLMVDKLYVLDNDYPGRLRDELSTALRRRQISEFLPGAVTVGSRLMTMGSGITDSEKRRDDPPFQYHYAGVVAVSGGDYLTMENYARRDDKVQTATGSSGDPLWFFYMYGTNPDHATSNETWHSRWVGSGSFGGFPLSFMSE